MPERTRPTDEELSAMRREMGLIDTPAEDGEIGGAVIPPTRPQANPLQPPTDAHQNVSTPMQTPASAPVQQQRPTQQPMSRQQQMMQQARMNHGQTQPTNSVVVEQGANYNPSNVQQTVPQQPQQMQQTQQVQQQATQQSQTADNTPQQNPKAEDTKVNTSSKGFAITPSKALIIVGAAVAVIVILLVFVVKNNGFSFGKQEEEVYDPLTDPSIEWVDPVIVTFKYTTEEIQKLRAAGYTGDEIEQYQAAEVPVEEMLEMAEEEQKEYLDEIAKKYDVTTPEFEEYISQTWLSLPKREDADLWTDIASYYQERKNFDYEKVEPHGDQLFLKIYRDDNAHEKWFYLNVTPEEWMKLKDSGNVIVTYTYCTRLIKEDDFNYYEDTDNIFITQASLEIIE